MVTPPSDTFFTASPDWHWLVVLYFFFGGLAGGCFFIGSLIDLFGGPRDWPLARLAYYAAFVAVLFCPPLLILDLNRPERFWHMLLQNHTLLPAFKYWSPMSAGSWALFLFGGFVTLAALGALAYDRDWRALAFLRRSPVRQLIAFFGGLTGFFLAGYTGVLLSVTNRAMWADSQLIGLLFLASAATTSAALLSLLGRRRGAIAPGALRDLARFERYSAGLELVALVAFVVTLGGVARVWLSGWGLLLALAVLLGIVLPLALHWRPRIFGSAGGVAAGAFALAGGFLLRTAVVLSAQTV